jgi:hypothetical protein
MRPSGRLLPERAIRESHVTETETTRHRITSFQFVEHMLMMGWPPGVDKVTLRENWARSRFCIAARLAFAAIGANLLRMGDEARSCAARGTRGAHGKGRWLKSPAHT